MNITVFGSSQIQPGSPAYADAMELGKLLAEAGHTVLTGGYMGAMEAVSRGANEAGGAVIGVTCEDIEAWRPIKANAWVREEHRHTTLQERLDELIQNCDATLALPGGPGTLTEIALTWNLMIVRSLPAKPLILIGQGWRSVLESLYDSFGDLIPQSQRDLVRCVDDVQSGVAIL